MRASDAAQIERPSPAAFQVNFSCIFLHKFREIIIIIIILVTKTTHTQ